MVCTVRMTWLLFAILLVLVGSLTRDQQENVGEMFTSFIWVGVALAILLGIGWLILIFLMTIFSY